jgi:LmbE family N-acetylglucosaminyl deacetylase
VIKLRLGADQGVRRVLAVGCHSDDIEIGCGGTLMRLLAEDSRLEVCWVVLCAGGARAEEARRSAEAFLARAARREVVVGDFRDGFLPYLGPPVKDFFESLKGVIEPDVIFTHQRADLHQDHRLACELTWNTFRDHLILEYEIPKFDGDLGSPNVFVELDHDLVHRKVAALMEHFATQRSKHWFTEDLFLSLMRLRGMECNASSRHAEAFYARKLVL